MALFDEIVNLLLEDKESDNRKKARKYAISRGCSPEEAHANDDFLRYQFPFLANKLNKGKFYLGATRMLLNKEFGYFNYEPHPDHQRAEKGELRVDFFYADADVIKKFNKAGEIICNAHMNEYDEDFNGLSVKDIINQFINSDKLKIDDGNLDDITGESDYDIIKCPTSADAQKIAASPVTSWCIAQPDNGQYMYNIYASKGAGDGLFYICCKHGYENVERKHGKNYPLDEYGLSMIAVCVDANGDPLQIVHRWNGPGDSMTENELSHVINMKFRDVFKPRHPKISLQDALASDIPLSEIFESLSDEQDGVAIGYYNKYYYFVDVNKREIIGNRYKYISNIDANGYRIVEKELNNELEKKCITDSRGNILIDKEFNDIYVSPFDDVPGYVVTDNYNFENILFFTNGQPHYLFEDFVSEIKNNFKQYGLFLIIAPIRISQTEIIKCYKLADRKTGEYEFIDWQHMSLLHKRVGSIIPVRYEGKIMLYNMATRDVVTDEKFENVNLDIALGTMVVTRADGSKAKLDHGKIVNYDENAEQTRRGGRPF